MAKKSSRETKGKLFKNQGHGIPRVLEAIHYEKVTEVIPVKVQLSLKKAVPKPQSAWIRQAIIEKLERINNE